MKKHLIAFAITLTLAFLAACSKDQKVVKQLDGTWKIGSVTVNGVPDTTDYSNSSYEFNACKVKKGDCDGTITEDGMSIPFTYNISEKGEKFTIKYNIFGFSFSETADIEEHSKTKFVFRSVENGETTVTTLVK